MKLTSRQAHALNDLLQRNYDAVKGYGEAATATDQATLKKWLQDNINFRKKFIQDLENALAVGGAEIEANGSVLGTLHRVWLDLRTDQVDNTDEVVLEECRRGEKYALEDYNKVLEEVDFHPDTRAMIKGQRKQIQQSLNSIEIMIPIIDNA